MGRRARPHFLKRMGQSTLFFGGHLMFVLVGSAVSIACLLPAAVFRTHKAHCVGQRLIQRLFAFFVGYLRLSGLLCLNASDLIKLRESRGLILVANHPSLLDVVFVVSQLPQVFCVMKASLARNIVLCGTARLAGYVNNDFGPTLVKTCRERLREGGNLLIFPEGTRSNGTLLRPFKMGFALVAGLTQAPVQTLMIKWSAEYLGKGWPLFKQPPFPVECSVRMGERFAPGDRMDVKNYGRTVEEYFRRSLRQKQAPGFSEQ
jgi:1-acyl-sn-glycerol-3-phosphate acyltransferase